MNTCGTAQMCGAVQKISASSTTVADMNNQIDQAAKGKTDDHAYAAAVLEFNQATLPLIVALTSHTAPLPAEVMREETARLIVVEARQKTWAAYGREKAKETPPKQASYSRVAPRSPASYQTPAAPRTPSTSDRRR